MRTVNLGMDGISVPEGGGNRPGFSGRFVSPASPPPVRGGGGMKSSLHGRLLAALLAAASLLFAPDEARAQAAACTPTQTVSSTADANGVYTTTLVCADTAAAAGAPDYRQLHFNYAAPHVEWSQTNAADRDGTLTNNNVGNHLSLTIGSGVVFTADGYGDQRSVITDGAIVLWTGAGDKSVTVQDGAVINLERTPTYWHPTTDPDRRVVTSEYNFNWYPTWQDALDGLTAIAVHSNTGDGDSDVTVRLDGAINVDIDIGGTYGRNNRYSASAGRAIDVQIQDTGGAGAARADIDALVELGSTGVIRHVEGSDGLAGIYVENRSEEGDITINLAEGSLIDVSEGGGYGVLALAWRDATNNNGAKTGDLIVNAAGTIRAAFSQGRVQSNNFGHGIFASQGANGRLLVTSSGTIETVQASAIDARAYASTNMLSGSNGHLVDVTAGTVETRGNTAIYASTGSVNADMMVRVAQGATVRAQALTAEDYANGAATQEELGATGNGRLQSPLYRFYGWRQVNVERPTDDGGTETVVRSEPIISAIVVRDFTSAAAADGVMDRVIVHGTVEAIGGKANVDPAIWMEGGGMIVVGPTGRVIADSGLAIEAGCVAGYRSGFTDPSGATTDCDSKPARDLHVTVDGTVEGDIRLRGDGDLKVVIRQTDRGVGRVTGYIDEMGGDGDPEVLYQFQAAGVTREVNLIEEEVYFGTVRAIPLGAYDLGIVRNSPVQVRLDHAPRARVYEALPPALLGLNRLPEFHNRMSAPRSAEGAWARVEAFRDKWEPAESTSSDLEYTYRRYGLKAGVDAAVGEHGLVGASLHHRQGKAEVSGSDGGKIDLSGRGVGMSGTWGGGDGDAMTYVDVQAEVTWYEADFRSALRGSLKKDVWGRGHALGVEVGRRYEVGGMMLTPRARLTHSKVSMDDFTDVVDARVSLEGGRSLRGSAGMAWDMLADGAPPGSRVFGSLDVEHEFSPDTETVVSGGNLKANLKAEARATWLRLGLNGSHAWGEDDRYSVQGGVSYATGGGSSYEFGGGGSLKVRF